MTNTESRPKSSWKVFFLRPLAWLLTAIGYFCRVLVIGWGTFALYYSNLPWPTVRLVMAIVFFLFGVWALCFSRKPRTFAIFAGVLLALLGWWFTIKPTHDRTWRREVAVMPRAHIDGDRVHLTGFRNFQYRSADDFTEHYEEREVLLSHLTSVDMFVSYWAVGPVGHTFVSFNFDNAPPVCVSIETRPEVGQGYDPIASLFKQFELIYVVGDERDIVRVRTDYRNEDVYLYRLNISPESARALFLVYLERINQLADHAEFYHLLSNSCTINIIRYANAVGRKGGLDLGHVLNGFIDRYLYRAGHLDTSLPFAELRRRSHINDAARAAGDTPDFSKRIRESLPTIPQ
jgi:hypothetical protein